MRALDEVLGVGLLERGLAVRLIARVPALEQADAEDLVERAHERCPYSNATRGNIDDARVVHGGAPVSA